MGRRTIVTPKAPLPLSIVNNHSDANENMKQPYRIVVRVGSAATAPPACFFVAAVRALRAVETERVLLLPRNGADAVVQKILADLAPFTLGEPPEVREDGAAAEHLNDTLLSASRVVWGDPTTQLPQPPVRWLPRGQIVYDSPRLRQPYEVVWTWCGGSATGRRRSPSVRVRRNGNPASGGMTDNDSDCPWLPKQSTDFEVQARARVVSMTPPDGAPIDCSHSMVVRSTWRPQSWLELSRIMPGPRATERKHIDLVRGEWMLENVCLGHVARPGVSGSRCSILAQADARTRHLLWPVPWPDMYAEYGPGFMRLDSQTKQHYLTEMINASMAEWPLHHCQWHESTTAVLTELTMDNLFHALLHAVPSFEMFTKLRPTIRADTNIHLVPHFTQYWPTCASNVTRCSFERAVGLQVLIRSLGVSEADWPEVAARAWALSETGQCNCYGRIYGGHSAFMPPPWMNGAELVRRVAAFGQALAVSFGGGKARTVERRLIFQLRRSGTRQIVNEDELRSAVKANAALASVVQFSVFESLPVKDQHALVSSSMGLAGMHGMGLAWTMLLPQSATGRTSCLEIIGEWSKFARLDYYSLSITNDVHFIRLMQPNWPGCLMFLEACGSPGKKARCNYRSCGNVTANVYDVVQVLHYMVQRFDRPGQAGGCVKVGGQSRQIGGHDCKTLDST